MELAVLSLNKNDQGPIFPSEAQTSLVGERFVIWQKTKQKNTGVMVNMEKCQPKKEPIRTPGDNLGIQYRIYSQTI